MTDQEDYDLVDMTATGTKIAEDSPNYENQKFIEDADKEADIDTAKEASA